MPLSPQQAFALSQPKRKARIQKQVQALCKMIDRFVSLDYNGGDEYKLPGLGIDCDIAEDIAEEIVRMYRQVGWNKTVATVIGSNDCTIQVTLRFDKE